MMKLLKALKKSLQKKLGKLIKKTIKINWQEHCYDPEFNICDGSCWGAIKDCPLRNYLCGETISKPTRKEMIRYFAE